MKYHTFKAWPCCSKGGQPNAENMFDKNALCLISYHVNQSEQLVFIKNIHAYLPTYLYFMEIKADSKLLVFLEYLYLVHIRWIRTKEETELR